MNLLPAASPAAVTTAGKWLRAGGSRWSLRGVSYGPFRPNDRGEPFPDDQRLAEDFARIRHLGLNTVRVYEPPSDAVLAAARREGLHLLAGIAWTDHVDFLRQAESRQAILATVRAEAARLAGHPEIAALLVGNEIEKTLVRWLGPQRVRDFLEELIEAGRAAAPQRLFAYASYPSTEYLVPRNADFIAFNIYLEDPAILRDYLLRLQNLAGNKPLVITEHGLDAGHHGEVAQAGALVAQSRALRKAAVAGGVWFSYTDEWQRGGRAVEGWQFGLVDADRRERPACQACLEPVEPTPSPRPRVSVIVCTHNGDATLRACLESLGRLQYPDLEVLLIDDGSTRDIAAIARDFPLLRRHRQEHAGLSAARNLGAKLATGDILAYTDDDCLPEPDWLDRLVEAFDDPRWVAAGGPNIPPPPRNRTEAVVAAAPGAPVHVLLDDTEAEHLPGCNLAIRRDALLAIGGFRIQYVTAGDDVDVCWRLREAGGRLRYVPGAMVWHHRRYRARDYLRQQAGYGRAEALLMKDHPERFGVLGGARWSGGIYGGQTGGDLAAGRIFHGPVGLGLFQGIYQTGPRCWGDWLGGLAWVAFALLLLALQQPAAAVGIGAASWLQAAARARHLPPAPFQLSLRERLLRLGLCWLQPLVRETARLLGMLDLGAAPGRGACWTSAVAEPRKWALPLGESSFWSESGPAREAFLREFETFVRSHHGAVRGDDGWQGFDLELRPEADLSPAIVTVEEYHGDGRCLLRVRRLLRLPPLLAIGLVIGLALLLWQSLAGSELAHIGLATLGLGTAAVLLVTHGLLHTASQRAALRSMERGA
jgi:GT2 family glycosyltransferase